MKTTLLAMAIASLLPVLAEPLPPIDMKLKKSEIQRIPIHSKVQTLLLFPAPVTMVTGEGITSGDVPGSVHAQLADDQRVLLIRALKPKSDVLMHVMVGKEAHIFRLQHSEEPASIVRFQGEKTLSPAKEVLREEVEKKKALPSSERQHQLVYLAWKAEALRAQLPEEYEGHQSRNFQRLHHGKKFSVELLHIDRFPADHVMVIRGKIHHTGNGGSLPEKLYLVVQNKRSYRIPFSNKEYNNLKPGESVYFSSVLVGDGKGGLLHLSLENEFDLVFNPQQEKS